MMSLNQRVLFSATLVLLIFIVGIAWMLDRAFYDSARLGVKDRLFAKVLMLMERAEVEDSGNWTFLPTYSMRNSVTSIPMLMPLSSVPAIAAWRSTSSLNKPVPDIPLWRKVKRIYANSDQRCASFCLPVRRCLGNTSGDYPLTFM